ncbi:MAG: ion channel [Acidimicrobiales bacterium]
MTPSAVTGSFRLPTLRSVLEFDSYGGVLVLIIITYVLTINLTMSWGPSVIIVVQIATVSIILRVSRAAHPIRVVAAISLLIAIVAAILALFLHHDTATRFLPAVSSLLYLIAPISVIRHLVRRTVIDLETILGAVAAYLLIGMFFAFVYRAAGANEGTPFFGAQGDGTFAQDLFFSFTTLTTTGYGNLVPAENPGQSFALAEMLVGQLFLVTAVANVINLYRPAKNRALAVEGSDSVGRDEPPSDDES